MNLVPQRSASRLKVVRTSGRTKLIAQLHGTMYQDSLALTARQLVEAFLLTDFDEVT